MDLTWLLRMARWVRHPPGKRQVLVMLVVLAVSLILVGIEHLWGWPAWLRVNSGQLRLPKP